MKTNEQRTVNNEKLKPFTYCLVAISSECTRVRRNSRCHEIPVPGYKKYSFFAAMSWLNTKALEETLL